MTWPATDKIIREHKIHSLSYYNFLGGRNLVTHPNKWYCVFVMFPYCVSEVNVDRVKNRRLCLKTGSSMVLHSLALSGLSSERAENGEKRRTRDGGRKRTRIKEEDTQFGQRVKNILWVSDPEGTLMETIVQQPEALVPFQPMEPDQVSRSCFRSTRWWRNSWWRARPSKGWRKPLRQVTVVRWLQV